MRSWARPSISFRRRALIAASIQPIAARRLAWTNMPSASHRGKTDALVSRSGSSRPWSASGSNAIFHGTIPLSARRSCMRTTIPFDGKKHDEKYEYIPVIWGPNYASGASIAGRIWKVEYAAEIKNSALASRPESWDATRIGFEHPTVNARLGLRPNQMWNFGFSASEGPYFRP